MDVIRMNVIEQWLSSWRLKVAAGLCLLTIVVGARTLWAYGSTGAYLALFTVVLLLAVDGVGFVSFLRAKRALDAELVELRKPTEPVAPFWVRRRERLLAVKALGASPDVDALIAIDEADLAGTTSFARYLVTASVLIGLVGTFAGLSETIGSFAPIFSDASSDFGDKLLAPLAGLAVTFGASVVAILATLALSLAAGDVTLAERQVLARLEERTRHELVPSIFPPSESVQAQTLRALAQMSSDWKQSSEQHLQQLQGMLATTGERWATEQLALTTKYSDATANVADRASQLVEDVVSRTLADWGRGLSEATRAIAAASTAASTSQQTLGAQHTAALTALVERHEKSASQASQALTKLATELGETHLEASMAATTALTTTLTAVAERHEKSLSQLTTGNVEATTVATTELTKLVGTLSETHVASSQAATSELQALVGQLSETHVASSKAATSELQALVGQLSETHGASSKAATSELQALVGQLSETHVASSKAATTELQTLVGTLSQEQVASSNAATVAFTKLVHDLSERISEVAREGLVRSSVELTESARRLQSSAEQFANATHELQPSVARLAPELSALTRETALLAASRDSEGGDEALVAELQRLAESVNEVKTLLAFGQTSDEAAQ